MKCIAIILAHRQILQGGAYLEEGNVAKIKRTLKTLKGTSVNKVCVVDGDHVDELRERLKKDISSFESVEFLYHSGWRQASGSVLKAANGFITKHGKDASHVLVLRADRPLTSRSLKNFLTKAESTSSNFDAVMAFGNPKVKVNDDECKVLLTKNARTGVLSLKESGPDLALSHGVLTGHAIIDIGTLHVFSNLPDPELYEGLGQSIKEDKVIAIETPWSWGSESKMDFKKSVAAIIKTKQHPGYTLLNPGPVNTTARVKGALVHHDVCHRDSNFQELLVSLTRKLRRIFKGSPGHSISVITGSGTAAMESAMTSAIPQEGKVLVIDNGAFGGRMFEIANVHEMDVVHLRVPWGDEVKVEDVSKALKNNPEIKTVVMTFHETSVGLINPVKEVGALCRVHDALFLVDAVSALGAEDVDVVRDNIDVCWASANKCLHSVSGAGFLCISPRAMEKIKTIKPRSFYLDLKRYITYAEERAQSPFTPAVSTYFALDEACSEFLEDGHEKRLALYKSRNSKIRDGLIALGIEPLTRHGSESHSVVTASVPSGITFERLYGELKQQGFIVYGCKDVLAGQFFQVANMGDIDDYQIDLFLETMAEVLSNIKNEESADFLVFKEKDSNGASDRFLI